MDAQFYHTTPFDSPVWEALLVQLERVAPKDMAAWREAEAAEFLANVGSRGLPDRALMARLIQHVQDIIRSDDKFAAPTAFSRLRGHVLRPVLAGRSDLLPEEARGRVLLTEPRTATDREMTELFAGYREACPDDYATWRATRIALVKYRLVNGEFAPLTAALDDAVDRTIPPLTAFIEARCWIQSIIARTTARSLLDKALMAGIAADELALTEEDQALRVELPSDEDILAFLEGYDFAPDVRQFTVTVRNANELRVLLDLTQEIMERERKQNWDARATSRSSDAAFHATCFRIMRQLNADVRAAREEG